MHWGQLLMHGAGLMHLVWYMVAAWRALYLTWVMNHSHWRLNIFMSYSNSLQEILCMHTLAEDLAADRVTMYIVKSMRSIIQHAYTDIEQSFVIIMKWSAVLIFINMIISHTCKSKWPIVIFLQCHSLLQELIRGQFATVMLGLEASIPK